MRMLKHVFSGQQNTDIDGYAELTPPEIEERSGADSEIRIAEIRKQQDLFAAKDALYDGNVVIVYLDTIARSGPSETQIIDELRRVIEEVGGDIVKKGPDHVIATPRNVCVNRNKIGGR